MITRDEILKGRDKQYPLSPALEFNLSILLQRVNRLRSRWGQPMIITSGYRPGHFNKEAKGAKGSKHLSCQAVDILDKEQALAMWLLNDQRVLVEESLWLEHPDHTPGWIHVQTVPPASGARIFRIIPTDPKLVS